MAIQAAPALYSFIYLSLVHHRIANNWKLQSVVNRRFSTRGAWLQQTAVTRALSEQHQSKFYVGLRQRLQNHGKFYLSRYHE